MPAKRKAVESSSTSGRKMMKSSTSSTANGDKASSEQKKKKPTPVVSFAIATNSPSAPDDHLVNLMNLKNIISAQLPNMPQHYITRLVMDRNHRSLCLLKTLNGVTSTIGGITFRPFHQQRFAEIVFLAVTGKEQVKGYGRRMMNYLKEHVKKDGTEYFLTYADNHAIGFFKKQGFSRIITMPQSRWVGYIKDYEGANLMACKINKRVDYLDIPAMIQAQRAAIYKKIHSISNTHAIYPGLKCFPKSEYIPITDIPGIVEAGWKPPKEALGPDGKLKPPKKLTKEQYVRAKLFAILDGMKSLKVAWPFQEEVDRKVVPEYYEIIKEPMDFGTMLKKFNNNTYKTKEAFHHDAMLVFNNCRKFNKKDTSYYRCAEDTQKEYEKLLKLHFPGEPIPPDTTNVSATAEPPK